MVAWAKDPKTFFFFDYQGQRIRQGQTFLGSVPTAAFNAGNFSAQGQFVRQQFPRIDPVGQNIINMYPSQNLPGLASNFLYNPVRITTAQRLGSEVRSPLQRQ